MGALFGDEQTATTLNTIAAVIAVLISSVVAWANSRHTRTEDTRDRVIRDQGTIIDRLEKQVREAHARMDAQIKECQDKTDEMELEIRRCETDKATMGGKIDALNERIADLEFALENPSPKVKFRRRKPGDPPTGYHTPLPPTEPPAPPPPKE